MTILTWNVRGFNKPSRAWVAMRLIRENDVGLFGLLEILAKLVMAWVHKIGTS